MPTPFTHLAFAQRLREDSRIQPSLRALVEAEWGAFLLGSVVADGHTLAGLKREDTHFYAYDRPMKQHPWLEMLTCHPSLVLPQSRAHQAFITGCVGHLSMDEVWSVDMLRPHFVEREWAPRPLRWLMLHILLIYMDERDLAQLPSGMADDLHAVQPHDWLPFLSDESIAGWGDVIYRQIKLGGVSETLDIFGGRINQTPEQLRAILDSPERMQRDLWEHISPALLTEIEDKMYSHAVGQMEAYLGEVGASS
jgi:hypothetical protein